MPPPDQTVTGGCQCGAVRFRAERLGGAAICHCRMCQKAFGSFFGPLVTGYGVTWTRGAPNWFESSDVARRGFCANCGTPLAYDGHEPDASLELAIGALDNPELAPPTRQVNPHDRLSFFETLVATPVRGSDVRPHLEQRKGGPVSSHQHPDHDTAVWPPAGGFAA
jgi:hypothetical protein